MGLLVAQTFILGSLQSDDLDAQGNGIYETLSTSAKAAVKTADLELIRNPYVGLGIFVALLLVVIAFVKMPEEAQTKKKLNLWNSIKRICKEEAFVGGVIAQLFYVGAQIMCWNSTG